jgi:DNA-binding IclR family transcriptional regulator
MRTSSITLNNAAGSVKSAFRVLDLLEALSVASEPVGASELARRLGIPKSSTHMLLATLERRGYVVGDETRRFRLNPLFAAEARGWVGGSRGAVRQLAREPLRTLAQVSGESTFLGVLRDARSFEYVDKVVSEHEVRCDAGLGQPRALHASSVGLVLLAYGAEHELERYVRSASLARLTPATLTDPMRLRRELATIRKRGYAVTRDTNAVGAAGIAAPILDVQGRALAGINISAPTSRFDDVLARAKDDLVRAARSIGAELAGRQARAA